MINPDASPDFYFQANGKYVVGMYRYAKHYYVIYLEKEPWLNGDKNSDRFHYVENRVEVTRSKYYTIYPLFYEHLKVLIRAGKSAKVQRVTGFYYGV